MSGRRRASKAVLGSSAATKAGLHSAHGRSFPRAKRISKVETSEIDEESNGSAETQSSADEAASSLSDASNDSETSDASEDLEGSDISEGSKASKSSYGSKFISVGRKTRSKKARVELDYEQEDEDCEEEDPRDRSANRTREIEDFESDNESLTPLEDDSSVEGDEEDEEAEEDDDASKANASTDSSLISMEKSEDGEDVEDDDNEDDDDGDADSEKEFINAVDRDDVDEDEVRRTLGGRVKRKQDFNTMTARQRAKALASGDVDVEEQEFADGADDELLELPLYEPSSKRKKLSKEEADLRRMEKLKQRRHQKERKVQEEKQATLAKLLNKSAGPGGNGSNDLQREQKSLEELPFALCYVQRGDDRYREFANDQQKFGKQKSSFCPERPPVKILQDVTSPTVMHMDLSETLPSVKSHKLALKPLSPENVKTFSLESSMSFPSDYVNKLREKAFLKKCIIDEDEAECSAAYYEFFFKNLVKGGN